MTELTLLVAIVGVALVVSQKPIIGLVVYCASFFSLPTEPSSFSGSGGFLNSADRDSLSINEGFSRPKDSARFQVELT